MLKKRMTLFFNVALAGIFAGCSFFDPMVNKEADEKMSRDETLKPSVHGVINNIKDQKPAAADPFASMGDLKRESITEPEYQDGFIMNDNLPKSGMEQPTKLESLSSTKFENIFAGRNANERIRVDFDADNLNISNIISRFAGDLKFNYTVESGVQGSVTMSLHVEMSLSEAWELFNQLLWMCNAYCDYVDGILYVRPLNQVTKDRRIIAENGSVMLHVVRMKYVSAESILEQIKPFLSSEATARILSQNNALLLIDTPENINRTLEIIRELDRNYKQGWYRVVVPCNQVSSRKIRDELKQILPVLGFQVVDSGNVDSTPGAIHLVSLDRLQVLVASASAIEPLVELRNWVNVLNRTDSEEKANAYIYKVVNGDASQLLTELSVLFPNMIGLIIQAKGGTTKTVNGVAAPNEENVVKNPNTVFEYPVRISANMEYNRLVIMTTQRVYGILRALLDRLDTIPPQVLLQVMVVEIELTDENSFGVEWSAQSTIGGETMNFGTDYSNLNPGNADQYGGNIHIFDPDNPKSQFLYIKALAGKTKMKVISSPQILVRSQYEATVNVGREVPTLKADITDTNSTSGVSTAVSRSYEYKQTGIILTVTPTVSEGGLISMSIEQNISEALKNTTSGLDTPIIKQDILSTNLSLRTGQTIVMGGLIRDREEEMLSSIPVLAEIPMLNWLGGDSSRTSARTEILVLISASIIDESTTLETMVRRYSDSLREINVFENSIYSPYQEQAKASGVVFRPEERVGIDINSEIRQDVMKMDEESNESYLATPYKISAGQPPEAVKE